MAEQPPTHLNAFSDDTKTLCGLKTSTTFPRMLARFVTAHRQGHERSGHAFHICSECLHMASVRGIGLGEAKVPE